MRLKKAKYFALGQPTWKEAKFMTFRLKRLIWQPCLEMCSTQRSPVHRVGMHASQIETPICTRRSTTYQFIWRQLQECGALGGLYQWNAEWLENTTRPRTFIPEIGNHAAGMAMPRTTWIRLDRLPTCVGRFRSCLYKKEYGSFCGLWVCRRQTDRWPCCPSLSNPSISP